MATPGIILQRFYTNDVVDGAKVDEHARVLSDAVNGGLTANSIAPQTRLASTTFLESRATFNVNLDITHYTPTPAYTSTTHFVANTACRLIGINLLAPRKTWSASNSSLIQATLYQNNAVAANWNIPAPPTQTVKGSIYTNQSNVTYMMPYSIYIKTKVDLASGDRLGMIASVSSLGSFDHAIFTFSVPWAG